MIVLRPPFESDMITGNHSDPAGLVGSVDLPISGGNLVVSCILRMLSGRCLLGSSICLPNSESLLGCRNPLSCRGHGSLSFCSPARGLCPLGGLGGRLVFGSADVAFSRSVGGCDLRMLGASATDGGRIGEKPR